MSSSSTLQDLYDSALSNYLQESKFELKDIVHSLAYTEFFGDEGQGAIVSDAYIVDLNRLLVGGPSSTPDFQGLTLLQESYRDGSRFGFSVRIWDPQQWGGDEVDLVSAVRQARQRIAMPDVVFGASSGVERINPRIIFTSGQPDENIVQSLRQRSSFRITDSEELCAKRQRVEPVQGGEVDPSDVEEAEVPFVTENFGDAVVKIRDAIAALQEGEQKSQSIVTGKRKTKAQRKTKTKSSSSNSSATNTSTHADRATLFRAALRAQLAAERSRDLVCGPENGPLSSASCFNWALGAGTLNIGGTESGWPEALFDWVSVSERVRHPWRSEGRPWKNVSIVAIQQRSAKALSSLHSAFLDELDRITEEHCARVGRFKCRREWEEQAATIERQVCIELMELCANVAGLNVGGKHADDDVIVLGMRGKPGVPPNFSHWWLEIPTGRHYMLEGGGNTSHVERVRCETCPGAPVWFSPCNDPAGVAADDDRGTYRMCLRGIKREHLEGILSSLE